ncbi:MAG: hypothetical protein AMXMBFR33_60660 [Candidatus Xenobia bacterium]
MEIRFNLPQAASQPVQRVAGGTGQPPNPSDQVTLLARQTGVTRTSVSEVKTESGVEAEVVRTQHGVALNASLPAGQLLPLPLAIQVLQGPGGRVTLQATRDGQSVPTRLAGDGKVLVQLDNDSTAPLAVFDPGTLSFGLASAQMHETILADGTTLIQKGDLGVQRKPTGELSATRGRTPVRVLADQGGELTLQQSLPPAGVHLTEWVHSPAARPFKLAPFSAALPGALFPGLAKAIALQELRDTARSAERQLFLGRHVVLAGKEAGALLEELKHSHALLRSKEIDLSGMHPDVGRRGPPERDPDRVLFGYQGPRGYVTGLVEEAMAEGRPLVLKNVDHLPLSTMEKLLGASRGHLERPQEKPFRPPERVRAHPGFRLVLLSQLPPARLQMLKSSGFSLFD